MSQQKAIKPGTYDSQRKSQIVVNSNGSYTMPFVIVSKIIGVCLSRKSRVTDHHGRQIMPCLTNKMFSAKSTQYNSLNAYKKLYIASLWTYKPGTIYVAASMVTDTQTHTQNDYRNPHACAEGELLYFFTNAGTKYVLIS